VKRDKLIISKPLRSGEEIITEDDIVVFARINSGAIIKTDGNAEIFGIVDGHIEVNGDYLILKNINKGEVIFNSESLDKTIFNGIIKKITFVDGVLDIKEL
jgi:septum site-determining protein MinC